MPDFDGGREVSRPLRLEGPSRQMPIALPGKPGKLSLNDGHQALVALRKRG